MSNETEPETRRFVVDLTSEQEKVLLKKVNHYLYTKRDLHTRESMLTNKLFQQLVNLLTTVRKDRGEVTDSFGHDGVRLAIDRRCNVATPAAVAAAAATPTAETLAEYKGRSARPIE